MSDHTAHRICSPCNLPFVAKKKGYTQEPEEEIAEPVVHKVSPEGRIPELGYEKLSFESVAQGITSQKPWLMVGLQGKHNRCKVVEAGKGDSCSVCGCQAVIKITNYGEKEFSNPVAFDDKCFKALTGMDVPKVSDDPNVSCDGEECVEG